MNQISLRGITIGSPTAQDILATALPELKPCPFCRNAIDFKLAQSKTRFDNTEVQIECQICGAKGPAVGAADITNHWRIAARVWNDYPSTKILTQ